ncbi:AraC family transcriptional regulator [Lysobacter sp. BMK333-48F3]|uniref:helix-turn-helix domain-containing protein n=1 Tax=Lysobacter sp. BMK333-48F3 TaxID=2867962 RepID=UPI001C8C5EFB|nr:AraC family transcriptional regulator [Lysobacter sp. BMK333-48F3]MBX9401975.1 AraC family transcriptional regulator [Lysobacter sp. BMK333-48F3]
MNLHHHRIHFAEHLDLTAARPGLHLIRASGRAVQLELPAGWLSLWLPLRGPLRLETADSTWELAPGHLQVWRDGRLRSSARVPCWWLCLSGPEAAWRPHLPAPAEGAALEPLPWEGVAPRDAQRLLVRLARRLQPDGERNAGALLRTLCALLLEQQRELLARLPRCSGRTQRRRQQTLLRLLRVQHLIRRHPELRLDLGRLARCASYSPCHLIRIYREVFDETPTEFASRLRSDRAWRMVRDTRMPVCEITEALGFESQSAFCRAFKNSFGLTATQARRLERATARVA